MKNTSLLLLAACGLPLTATAQDASRHHVGVGLPVWLKARAAFTGVRATDPGPNPVGDPLASARERFYDDGYNRVDSSGNAVAPPLPALFSFPRTSRFGYASDTQVNNLPASPATGGDLALHSFAINGGDYTKGLENVPFPGLELFYRYDVKSGDKWKLGVELGAAYHFFQWEQSGPKNATVDLITDVFALGGVPLPAPSPVLPYPGPFTELPGSPVIGSTPVRTPGTAAAVVTGNRSLDLHALQFRLGPTLDWHPNDQWSVGAQVGAALGLGWSRLGFNETVTITAPNTPVIAQRGASYDTHLWAGLFTALRLNRQLGEHWSAHVDVRHMWTGTLHHNGPLRAGAISLSDGLGVAAGVSYRF